jgi:hypothetical protein
MNSLLFLFIFYLLYECWVLYIADLWNFHAGLFFRFLKDTSQMHSLCSFEWSVNDESENMCIVFGRKQAWIILRYNPSIFLEELSKPRKLSA